MFNLNNVIIDCNGTGQAKIVNGRIEFTANSPEDSVNIRFNPSFRFTGNLLVDIKSDTAEPIFDIKFFGKESTYLVQQIPITNEPVEIDMQGSDSWAGRDIIILKFSAYSPGNYTIGNFRYGRYNSGETNRFTYEHNLIPNGDFEMGLLGFTLFSSSGRFSPKSGKDNLGSYFRFEHERSDNGKAGGYIYSGDILLKKGSYYFETQYKSDTPTKFRWMITNPAQTLSGQYWLDMSNTNGQVEESRDKFTVEKDTRVQVYFIVDGPVSVNLYHMLISPAQNVSIRGNEFILNGSAEHVIGIYHGTPQQCVQAGFKHHKPNYIPTQDDTDFYMNNGVNLWADISGLMRAHKLDGLNNVFKVYNQPNVVGWYSDEPDHIEQNASPALCRKMTEMLSYTGLPHFGVVMSWPTQSSNAFQYQDSFNILGTDIYAKDNGKDLVWLSQKIKDFMRTKIGKPRWIVVESRPDLSYNEQRVQAWLPMALGADGVWFWVLDNNTNYSVLRPVIDELKNFKHITGVGVIQKANVPCSMRFGQNRYIVGVNPTSADINVVIEAPGQVIPLLNAQNAKGGNTITLTCKAYEPFVLRVV